MKMVEENLETEPSSPIEESTPTEKFDVVYAA